MCGGTIHVLMRGLRVSAPGPVGVATHHFGRVDLRDLHGGGGLEARRVVRRQRHLLQRVEVHSLRVVGSCSVTKCCVRFKATDPRRVELNQSHVAGAKTKRSDEGFVLCDHDIPTVHHHACMQVPKQLPVPFCTPHPDPHTPTQTPAQMQAHMHVLMPGTHACPAHTCTHAYTHAPTHTRPRALANSDLSPHCSCRARSARSGATRARGRRRRRAARRAGAASAAASRRT